MSIVPIAPVFASLLALSSLALPVLAAPAGSVGMPGASAPLKAVEHPGPAVRGLIVQLNDAPAHRVLAADAGDTEKTQKRRIALARTDSRWRALLKTTGLGLEPGLRLEPIGRNAFRVVFDQAQSGARVAHWVATLGHQPDVRWVVANERETVLQAAAVVPNDPLYGHLDHQWWLLPPGGSNANAPVGRLRGLPGFQPAWARTTGKADVVVAVLDTGITSHPDLDRDRLLPGFDMVSDWDGAAGRGYANDGDGRDADASDPGNWVDAEDQQTDATRYGRCHVHTSNWHGTAVTSFLAASTDNALGAAAATWHSRILPVRIAGKCGAEVADIVDGMRWAAGLPVCQRYGVSGNASSTCAAWAPLNPTPARVVNISFGGASTCNAAYQQAVDELFKQGVVVVAAAGNDHGAPTRPANCRGVVGVAALNRDGFKAAYSNFGPALKIATVGGDAGLGNWGPLLSDSGLLALGNDGVRTPGDSIYAHHYGTSFSAPVVSATLALMLAADPRLSADELMAGLAASARPHVTSPTLPTCDETHPGRCICTTSTCGAGILDADQAVAYAQAHAAGLEYLAPRWPLQVIANPEVTQAVAAGPDLGDPMAVSRAAPVPDTTSTGGGAVLPRELIALAGAAWLIGRRRGR